MTCLHPVMYDSWDRAFGMLFWSNLALLAGVKEVTGGLKLLSIFMMVNYGGVCINVDIASRVFSYKSRGRLHYHNVPFLHV